MRPGPYVYWIERSDGEKVYRHMGLTYESQANERCEGCGHIIGARCTDCGREMLCGEVAIPCPQDGCREGLLPHEHNDLQGGSLEAPRKLRAVGPEG